MIPPTSFAELPREAEQVARAAASPAEESFSEGLLEYPQFTRPQTFENNSIPEVLTNGNHKEIAKWRRAEAEHLTRFRRPDLMTLFEKTKR